MMRGNVASRHLSRVALNLALTMLAIPALCSGASGEIPPDHWSARPSDQWPQITMINEIDYVDHHHPVAGCGFLLDTGTDTLAVTAKHILTYFKSEAMDGVDFKGTLRSWKMHPKDNPADVVIIDALINADPKEAIAKVDCPVDWLLFRTKTRSLNIQPLRLRTDPLVEGEPVYIVGWRYSDKNCRQVVYRGNYVRSEGFTHLISTELLTDNKIPGLSGSPVIDAEGRFLGLMSQKAGSLERLSSSAYPRSVLGQDE